jgi:Kdo2-lipid IVA lauroyltransferase/acyltransferase
MDAFKAVLLRGVFRLISLLPVRLVGGLGAGLGRLAYYLDQRHRSIATRNITRIYPHKPRAWRTRTARESFAELGRTLFELPHVFLLSKESLKTCVAVEGEDDLRAALAEGKGALIAACHHGNWELGALMFSLLGYPIDFFYRPVRQPILEAYLKQCRERFGARLHARQESVRWVMRALKNRSCIALMIDQHIGNGIPVPFLGHLANTLTLPAVMAHRTGAPVLCVALHRIGHGFRFRLRFWRIATPATFAGEEDFTWQLTRDIADCFTPVIDSRPEMWLWSHQRWKLLEEQNRDITEAVYGTP